MNELSRQELQGSRSKVNQLTVQIQKVQDKVNSLNDSRGFHDPEMSTSSGFSHVSSHPLIGSESSRNAQPRFLPAFQDTELTWHRATFLKNPPTRNEPTASCSAKMYARSLTATHCEPASEDTGRSVAKMNELERNTQNIAMHQTEI